MSYLNCVTEVEREMLELIYHSCITLLGKATKRTVRCKTGRIEMKLSNARVTKRAGCRYKMGRI